MKKKKIYCLIAFAAALCLSACGNNTIQEQATSKGNSQEQATAETEQEIPIGQTDDAEASQTEQSDSKILVAYFTRLPNTESGDNLDAVVQGGGPYGLIGDNFENADMDAISSASITVTDEGVKGNTQTVAEWIAEYTGGNLFSIETADKYPLDYDTLIDQGGEEQQNRYRPELITHIENIEQYSVIYLGYPNWYHDMPMALYSFLEEYDLEGKTIVPFATSAGSGLANTISTITDLQPKAIVIENGLSLGMRDIGNSQTQILEWVDSLSLEQ